MSHLGDVIAALVDNDISHDARDRALAHIAGCADCRAEVDHQRRLKALLANQADPQPSAELQARLRAIADQGPGTPADSLRPRLQLAGSSGPPRAVRTRRSWLPATAASFAPARPSGRSRKPADRSPSQAAAARPGVRRRTVRRLVAGSASALVLTVALAAVGGSAEPGAPGKLTPPVDRFLQEHTQTASRLPLGDAGVGLVESVSFGR
jgi:hypothetical protein